MSHYFETDDALPNDRKEISFRFLGDSYSLLTIPGVFSKNGLDFGTRVLIETVLKEELAGPLLDLGSGYGPIGILIKHYRPDLEVWLSEINERAAAVAKENLGRCGLDCRLVSADGLAGIAERFGTIVFNPPIRAGKKIIYRLFRECRDHLSPGGRLYIVIRKDQGAQSAGRELEKTFGSAERIHREKGYEVFRAAVKG